MGLENKVDPVFMMSGDVRSKKTIVVVAMAIISIIATVVISIILLSGVISDHKSQYKDRILQHFNSIDIDGSKMACVDRFCNSDVLFYYDDFEKDVEIISDVCFVEEDGL